MFADQVKSGALPPVDRRIPQAPSIVTRFNTPEAPGQPDSDDCGGCGWFCREEPFAIIGVCMCEALRREQKEEEK